MKGEFYWRVEQGETVRAIDYVSAPLMLSEEISGSEMNWSAGVYMTNAEIEKAFGVTDLPKPWSVAPNQPFTGSFYYTWGLAAADRPSGRVAVFLVPITGLTKSIYSKPIVLPPMQTHRRRRPPSASRSICRRTAMCGSRRTLR